ncbi:hypothetical protein IE53DRAFT_11310 [Violaceomyces palustris]|uniref:Uncharacterized protein n=1 Tax=Violaceomyces palustris TaxID=1673888 RepID=A0ACD0NLL2_9BASI|nr:hypothetical protein IE53DRAFT_11310 [Violaceomyces palustris]
MSGTTPATPDTKFKSLEASSSESPSLFDRTLSPALLLTDQQADNSLRHLHRLHDTPVSSQFGGRPLKQSNSSRPSWGPTPDSRATKSKLRLLADLPGPSDASSSTNLAHPNPTTSRSLGGVTNKGKPRFSLFAKPAFASQSKPLDQDDQDPLNARQDARSGGAAQDAEDDSLRFGHDLLTNRLADTSGLDEAENLMDDGDDTFLRHAILGHSGPTKGQLPETPTSDAAPESREQMQRQLAELRKMNDMFEAYESMLRGSANQIETFAQRIEETDALLDVYIDLLRQSEQTQQLLQDGDWKGATEDASAHALSLALAEREAQRLREEAEAQAEAEEAARIAAEDARQEAARRKAAMEEKSKAGLGRGSGMGRGGARGARGGGGGGGGTLAPRGASTVAGGRGRGTGAGAGIGRPAGSAVARSASSSNSVSGIARGRSVSGSGSATRGARGGGGATAASGRIAASSAGSTTTTRRASSNIGGGLGGQYSEVKSSGYGPR